MAFNTGYLICVEYQVYRFSRESLIALYEQIASDMKTGRTAPGHPHRLAWMTELGDIGGIHVGSLEELENADPQFRKQLDHMIDEDEFDPQEQADALKEDA